MTISPEELRDVYDECGGDLAEIASRLGVPLAQFPGPLVPAPPRRRRSPPADLGHRSGWPHPKHIVATRHCDGSWSSDDQSDIDKARANYEAGTHEMCQGRDRDWFVLFSIPRRKRCGARRFFQMEVS